MIDNNNYLQLHLVHWNCDSYASFDEAQEKEDGLLIIAVFIQVCTIVHTSFSGIISLRNRFPDSSAATVPTKA
jgi:hypothetical protein